MSVAGALVLMALCCAAAPAAAQLTAFGMVDLFATRIDADGAPVAKRIDASGLLASRVGFKGREDLGGGASLNFMLEAGMNGDEGSFADSNRLFNRQAWIGLAGPWGELRAGRQNTPQFLMNGRFDAFLSATQASGWNNLSGAPPRVDAALGYFTPSLAGVKLQILLGRGAAGGAAPLAQSAANRHLHAAAEYEEGPLYLGSNYEEIKNTASPALTRRTYAGGSWKFTPAWTLWAAFGREVRADQTLDQRQYSVSAAYQPIEQGVLAFGYARALDRLSGAGHGGAWEPSLCWRYQFSKRSSFYSAASYLRQQDQRASFVLGGAAVVAASARIAATPGGSIRGLQAGLLHSF